ncbi:MAG: bifunctional aspartate transaminase/aspartate 4-decarboxylase [[Eubacterium] sulci]|nr:bifunctional aspartate transaminase/aspartate 4-decarboxylase [[Eubacterium] sulci]
MITKSFERKLEKLGAFEISFDMLRLSEENEKHLKFLNAGRGNPNWTNTLGRLAFARLMEFGVSECKRTLDKGDLAGYVDSNGIEERYNAFLNRDDEVDVFLKKIVEYSVEHLDLDKKSLILELTNGIIGNNYPVPSRCLENTEHIINAFLQSILYGKADLRKNTKVFPVEGGTAAIVYIFDSLKHNGLLNDGDHIAINTPVFTPYIQIPRLSNFDLAEIDLQAREENQWHIPDSEFEKLLDPSVKAFFLVNPSNPGSRSLTDESLEQLRKVVEKRPDLIIITDDVYGTFVNGFRTVYSVCPRNTILVYSYSKLYGVTGWRLGVIAINEDNVFDELIKKLPEKKKKELESDYSIVTLNPSEMGFVERICADSRSIGLYHTSGLSTPQQIMMVLFSMTHLVLENEKDQYIEACKEITAIRYHNLMSTLGLPEDNSDSNAKYYTLIDIYQLAETNYDKNFATWLRNEFEEIDFLLHLAKEDGVVLMEGVGFGATPGTVRISEANLEDNDYKEIANRIISLLKEYYEKYIKEKKL